MSNTHSQNNKRIAKNTMMLYVRMLFSMLVSLYTSRVILENLGVEDYGIYSVVGGVVAMFTMVSSSLAGAISRFITFELGKGNQKRLNIIFSTSIIIQVVICIIIVLLVETIGVWFLENKMNIPIDRMVAARWVLHISLLSLIINLVSIPYSAVIIAHERMSAFAAIGILQVLGNLIIAFLIGISPIDKLIYYAALICFMLLCIRIVYGVYCKIHFEECKNFRVAFDKDVFREMLGFAGWVTIGTSAEILRDHGGNILLNIFGGPAVNAARGISLQVNHAVTSFATNFIMALNPQITKSYASGDHKYLMTLVFTGSRFSYYLLITLSLPILLNTNYILNLWLKNVPDHAVLFVQLALIRAVIESLSNPLLTVINATGDIRNYQIIVGGFLLLNLPISYLLLKVGFFPEVVVVVAIFIAICCLCLRLCMLKRQVNFPIEDFFRGVILNVLLVTSASLACPLILLQLLDVCFMSVVFICIASVVNSLLVIYFIGCDSSEKQIVVNKINSIFHMVTKR